MTKRKTTRRAIKRTIAKRAERGVGSDASLLDLVRENVLFTGVSSAQLEMLAPKFVERHFDTDEVVFDERTKGRDLYLIASGKIRIKKYTKYGIESLLAVLHAGDFFGELSIIDGMPRSARAEAVEPCRIISFTAADYRSLFKESSAFSVNLLKRLAMRLRTIDQMFVNELERSGRAYKNKVDKLDMLIEASKIVNSSISIDDLLVLILDAAARSINADRGTLYLINTDRDELWSKVAQGNNMREIRLPLGKGLAGYVAKTGETINIADAYNDPRFNPEIDKKSGYKTRNVLCMPMRDKEGLIVGVFQFLNKRKGAFTEEDSLFIDALSVHASIALENARLVQEVIKRERLSAVGQMASSIIHDIKNPMATLRMYAQVIKKKSENKESAGMADEIVREVDRFINMTQEVLDFSRGVSALNVETVRLDKILPVMLSLVQRDLAKKNITLVQQLEYAGEVMLDMEKMTRVIYNLAGNAADAMPHGGTFTVRTAKTDETVTIECTDSGVGMSDEVKARAFEPFFTHGKKHGTGLGLAIVEKIIEDHRGSVDIQSTVNKGTTVRITLPGHCTPANGVVG